MPLKISLLSIGLIVGSAAFAGDFSHKIHLDPVFAAAGYANVQLDRSISPTVSAGAMLWHLDEQSWGYQGAEETSIGVRIDWFESGVYASGWHSNAMLKVDLEDGRYARTRLKLTQTFQFARGGMYANLGIGAQLVGEADWVSNGLYEYRSWLLPAWEFSIGRAF